MNPAEIEEVKGSLKQLDDKFDRLIQKVEECKATQERISQTVKAIIYGVQEMENKK